MIRIAYVHDFFVFVFYYHFIFRLRARSVNLSHCILTVLFYKATLLVSFLVADRIITVGVGRVLYRQ